MTDQISISGLPLSQPLTGNEVLPMDQGPSTVQATAQQIASLAAGTNLDYEPATRTITSSTGGGVQLPEVSATVAGLVPPEWLGSGAPFASIAQGIKAETAVQPGTLAAVLSDYVLGTDFRLSDNREWSAATVEQPEAEAGTATTRRAWTAQRVRQAVAGWWTATSTAAGRLLVTAADATAQRTALGLGDSATRNVGTAAGTVAAGDAPAVALASHLADADPHPVYLRSAEILAGTNVTLDKTTTPGSVIINAADGGTGGTPGGSSGQAQFNNAGAFAGASGLTIDPTTGRLTLASFLAAASAPATPASAGFALYAAPTTGALSWRGANGFIRTLNATGNTDDRAYQLQDKSGTLAHLDDIFNGYVVGNYIMPAEAAIGSGTALLSANLIYLYPFTLKRSAQVSELGARVNTAVASSVFQLAVYETIAGLPGTVLASTADISGVPATVSSSSVTPTTLRAGLVYWFAVNSSIAGIVFQAPINAATHANSIIGNNSLSNVSSAATITTWNRSFSYAYGTWPDLTGQATAVVPTTRAPSPILRISALL